MMDALNEVIMRNITKDIQSAKTYRIGKKGFMKLVQDYCEYEMPKMNHIEFKQYKGTHWLEFLNKQGYKVKVTLDKFWGKYSIRVYCGDEGKDNVTALENDVMSNYFVETK